MNNQAFDISDKEKFELEFVSTSELAHIAQKHKVEIEQVSEKMRIFGKSHNEYAEWKSYKHRITKRREYVLSRIKARQLVLL